MGLAFLAAVSVAESVLLCFERVAQPPARDDRVEPHVEAAERDADAPSRTATTAAWHYGRASGRSR